MVSELTLNKKTCKTHLLLVIALLVACFCGCDMRAGQYPFHIADEWVCDEPCFMLTYPENTTDAPNKQEVLVWENQTFEVEIMFGLGDYCIFPKGSYSYRDRLLTGTWKYRNRDLILIIEEDFLFGNRYTELVFSPVT